MIKEEKILNNIFIEQTTYYIYKNEEDRQLGFPSITTSDQKLFKYYKDLAKKQSKKYKNE